MDDDEFPATQPVLPTLLRDVVAFVEVRSDHDNLSRGVISELRSLGASIAPTLNKDVTHVVFHGGHVSTYKRAKQQMCNLVAVSWIEASKELGLRAPENEHPPLGFEKYEDPHAARRIRVLKSMQPDFDNKKDDERLNAKLEKIKKKSLKKSAISDNSSCKCGPGEKKMSTASDKKSEGTSYHLSRSLESCVKKAVNEKRIEKLKKRRLSAESKITINTAENCSSPKRTRKNTREVKSGDPLSFLSCRVNNITEENNIRGRTIQTEDPKLSSFDDNRKNGVDSTAQRTCRKSFEFVMPNRVKTQKYLNGSVRTTAAVKKQTPASSSGTSFLVQTAKSDTENEASITSDQKTKDGQFVFPTGNESLMCSGPLVFIENITRGKNHPKKAEWEGKAPQHVASARQTRRSVMSIIQERAKADSKKCQSDTNKPSPLVARVFDALAKKSSTHRKSPFSGQSVPTERRQSPRLSVLRKEDDAFSSITDSDTEEEMGLHRAIVPTKKVEPRRNPVFNTASSYMLKFFKAKPPKITSPEVALLDISFGPPKILQCRKTLVESDTSGSPTSSNSVVDTKSCKQDTRVENGGTFWKSLLEIPNSELTDSDRSDSPILGTRVKHRLHNSVLSRSKGSTPGITPLPSPSPTATKGLACRVATATGGTSHHNVKNKTEVIDQNEGSFRRSTLNCSESGETTKTEHCDSSTRTSRKRTRREKLPTLVCTHLKRSDVEKVMKAVRDLGKFEFEEQVSERTTHVVASGPRRTINMLRAVARGCWIVKDDWVYQSVKAGRWLHEDNFELTEFSTLVQGRRMMRQSSGGLGQWDLLSSVGPIFVSKSSQPPASDLKDLILLSGGTLSKTVKEAAIIIGPQTNSSKNAKPRVAPVWVLDCIQKGIKLPFLTPECTEKA